VSACGATDKLVYMVLGNARRADLLRRVHSSRLWIRAAVDAGWLRIKQSAVGCWEWECACGSISVCPHRSIRVGRRLFSQCPTTDGCGWSALASFCHYSRFGNKSAGVDAGGCVKKQKR